MDSIKICIYLSKSIRLLISSFISWQASADKYHHLAVDSDYQGNIQIDNMDGKYVFWTLALSRRGSLSYRNQFIDFWNPLPFRKWFFFN